MTADRGGDHVLVSACLAGIACRHDGGARPHDVVLLLARNGIAVEALRGSVP